MAGQFSFEVICELRLSTGGFRHLTVLGRQLDISNFWPICLFVFLPSTNLQIKTKDMQNVLEPGRGWICDA